MCFAPALAAAAQAAAADEGLLFPSWSDVLEIFLSVNSGVEVFGLSGEGALPGTNPAVFASGAPGPAQASLWTVLSSSVPPTAVVARSRSREVSDGAGATALAAGVTWSDGEWLSDKLVAQVTQRRTQQNILRSMFT